MEKTKEEYPDVMPKKKKVKFYTLWKVLTATS